MPGLANLLYLGQPDPAQQLARMLSGQQQPGPGQGAAPPGTAPPPPPDGAAAAGPGGAPAAPGAPQNLTPGAPPPPGSPPQPTVLQSTPDMASSYAQLANPNILSLYVQMQERDQAMAGINNAFAQIAANHSMPAMRSAIMQNANAGGGDAGQMFGNIMSLYGQQQQMAANQQLLGEADAMDQKLGLPPGTSRAEILAGRGGDLVSHMETQGAPPDAIRNYQWAVKLYLQQHPGATQDDIDQNVGTPQQYLIGAMGGDADTKSWRAAQFQWDQNPQTRGTPYPWGTGSDNNPTRFRAWSGAQVEADKAQAADQTDAAKLGPTYRANLQGARDRVANAIGLKGYDQNGDPILDPARQQQLGTLLGTDMAQKFVNADPTKGGAWDQDVATWWGSLKPEDQALLTQIRDATDPNTVLGALAKKAPRRGQSDVSDIGVGLGGMRNVTQPLGQWMPGALGTLKSLDTGIVNSFGAAGTPEQAEDYAQKHGMPVDALGQMDESYLQGGSMYPKGKIAATMTPQQLTAATAAIKAASDPEAERQKQIRLAMIRNTDPTPLKNM